MLSIPLWKMGIQRFRFGKWESNASALENWSFGLYNAFDVQIQNCNLRRKLVKFNRFNDIFFITTQFKKSDYFQKSDF
ncbi:MAG: hypothetical protein KAI83_17525 [Thiomargarita sp.]|nr:hypothetical protein [Thiomargarita sp.]